jgi:hypothetical protein
LNRCCASIAAVAFCFVTLAGASPALAQALGVKAGVTFTTQRVTPDDALGDIHQKSGLVAGGFVTFGERRRLVLEVGGQLALRRTGFGPDIEDKLTYLEVPVVIRWPFLSFGERALSALAGGSVNFLLSAKESISGETYDVKSAYESIDAAAVVGAHVAWSDRWSFEGRYLYGLIDPYVEAEFVGIKTRQHGFQFSAGYRFR